MEITSPDSRFYVHVPKDRSESVNECIGLFAPVEITFIFSPPT